MPYKNIEEQREYDKRWRAERRTQWINEQGGKCVDCDSTEQLEIDHVDYKLKACNVATLWSRKKDIRDKELVKCVVRCNACHMLKTIEENKEKYTIYHDCGTYAKYKRGCKCQDCKSANNEYQRINRRPRRKSV